MQKKRAKAVLVAGAGLALFLFMFGFVIFATVATRNVGDNPARADGIVVLTGGESRIAEAVRLFVKGKAKRLLISGVNRRASKEELRRLIGLGGAVFDCCVDIGYDALDTSGNAGEARAWATQWQFSSLIVVTASYHMPRSIAELGLAMPSMQLFAHPVVPRKLKGEPWWLDFNATRMLAAEYLKLLPVATRVALARLIRATEGHSMAGVLSPIPAQL